MVANHPIDPLENVRCVASRRAVEDPNGNDLHLFGDAVRAATNHACRM